MIERRKLMQNDVDTIYFKAIENKPQTLFILEISKNPNHWINQCYNVYFEKPNTKIILKNAE